MPNSRFSLRTNIVSLETNPFHLFVIVPAHDLLMNEFDHHIFSAVSAAARKRYKIQA